MNRVWYMHKRERAQEPYYLGNCSELWAFRALCVDRIFKLGSEFRTRGATPFAAVRMFDFCLSRVDLPKIEFRYMSVLAVACFDVAHKCIGCDGFLPIATLAHYAQNPMNEAEVPEAGFVLALRAAELDILEKTGGEPIAPTPHDYIAESPAPDCPRASMLCAAFAYSPDSTACTCAEIAAAAALLSSAKADLGTAMNTLVVCIMPDKIRRIQQAMTASAEKMFGLDYDSGFCRAFREINKLL